MYLSFVNCIHLHCSPLYLCPQPFSGNGERRRGSPTLTAWRPGRFWVRLTDGVKSCKITLLAVLFLSLATVRVGTGMLCLVMEWILLFTAEPHIRPLISCVGITLTSRTRMHWYLPAFVPPEAPPHCYAVAAMELLLQPQLREGYFTHRTVMMGGWSFHTKTRHP